MLPLQDLLLQRRETIREVRLTEPIDLKKLREIQEAAATRGGLPLIKQINRMGPFLQTFDPELVGRLLNRDDEAALIMKDITSYSMCTCDDRPTPSQLCRVCCAEEWLDGRKE